MMKNKVTGYMCKTDFDFELGHAKDGATVFPSIKALKEYKTCVCECGIVEVEVSLSKIIQDENWTLNIE